MASFTEYVKLIAEGNEAVAVIEKINAAIAKLRKDASSPINVKINAENEKIIGDEKKIRTEKKNTSDAELTALKKKKEEIAAIKAMNKEQGNPAFNIRYGSQESIAQGQKFNEHLSEATRRINRLADAHKHIKATAKAADVEVSASLSEKLAQNTVLKTEKAETQAIREAARAEKDRIAAINLRNQQEEEGERRIIQMERERVRLIREREKQEEQGNKRIIQLEAEKERIAEKQAREERRRIADAERAEQRARREREQAIASSREGGIRGVIGEFHRDLRRKMMYGTMSTAESAVHSAYEADVAKDTAIENVRQTGRTPQELAEMIKNAEKLSLQNPTITATELLTMQQHNIGAFGDYKKGTANNEISARYLAIRKGKVGEDEALKENMAILKVGEETGRLRDKGFMAKLYDQQLKMAQSEGTQYDPSGLLTSVRMLKSSKFGLSDNMLLTLLPFMGMSEGNARIGNQIAMFAKTMTFSGKQLKASGVDYGKAIAGTAFSDGKGGYNQEMQTKVMSGDFAGVAAIVDKYLSQKGFNPADKSTTNVNKEMQQVAKAVSNTSAREVLLAIWANQDQFRKQQENAAKAEGASTPQLSTRTLQGAQDALTSQTVNAMAATLQQFNPLMIRVMNGLTVIAEWATKHPNSSLGTIGAAAGGLLTIAVKNPEAAVQTGLLTAIVQNTGAIAVEGAAGNKGAMAKLLGINPLLLGAAVGVAAQKLFIQPMIDDHFNQQQENAVNTLRKDVKTREKFLDQIPVKIANKDYNQGDKDDPRPTLEAYQVELRLAQEAARREERDLKESMAKHAAEERSAYPTPKSNNKPTVSPPDNQSWHAHWRLGDAASQGYMNSGGIVNNAAGSAKDQLANEMNTSTAKAAIEKVTSTSADLSEAITKAGTEIHSGTTAAASSIEDGGHVVGGALHQVADVIANVSARIAAMASGAPKSTSTGSATRGPK